MTCLFLEWGGGGGLCTPGEGSQGTWSHQLGTVPSSCGATCWEKTHWDRGLCWEATEPWGRPFILIKWGK